MIWNVDPVIARIGPLALRWYSLFFALGFLVGYFMVKEMFKKEQRDVALLDSLLVYVVIATLVGARLGQVLFYEPVEYLRNPLEIVKIWEGGLASHGGFAAVLLALMIFCRKHRDVSFLWLNDRLAIPVMLAAGFIRIGNLFNSEIIGRPASVPWAVIFTAVDAVPRHPTQIYESLGYLATSLTLYVWYRATGRQPREGRLLGMAMVLGFGWRFVVEFLKEHQEAFEAALPLNMGQLLSVPFILIGLFLLSSDRKGRAMFAGRRLKMLFLVALLLLGVAALVATIIRPYFGEEQRRNVLTASGQPELVVMDFSEPLPLDPLPEGWRHREFWTRRPMDISFGVKEGRPAIRLTTNDSASMLFRHVDVDLVEYPVLAWQWYVEQPVESLLDERTSEGDDHPARLFIAFRTGAGERRAMEIIWGNRLRAGEYKYIGDFPHYVANGGEENVRQWQDETVDLLSIYREIWGDEPAPRVTDIALFCDSDETNTSSIAYFGSVTLKQRPTL